MITWLQLNVFKHQRVLFGILLTIVIIAFVAFSGSGRSFLDSTQARPRVEYLGLDLSNPRVKEPLARRTEISGMMNYERGDMIQRATQLVLCDSLGIAEPTPAQIAKHIEGVKGLQVAGKPDRSRLTAMIDSVKSRHGIDQKAAEILVEETLAEDWRIARLEQVLGSPGVLLPAEALARARDEKTVRSVDVAEMTLADHTAKHPVPEPAADALEKFFKANAASYAVPAKPRYTAVVFEGTTLVPALAAKPEEAELKSYFEARKAKYMAKPQENAIGPAVATPEPTFESVRDKVLADVTTERLSAAREEESRTRSESFMDTYAEKKLDRKSPQFATLVTENKGRVITLPPLAENDPALPYPFIANEFYKSTAHLSATEAFTLTPVKISGGYAYIFFDALEPGRDSKLEEVRAQVVAKWKEGEAETAWDKAVTTAREELVKTVAAGGNFREGAEKAGFKVTAVEDFSVTNVPVPALRDFLVSYRIGGVARVAPLIEKLRQGEVSDHTAGRIAFLRKITVPALTTTSPEVTAVIESGAKELSQAGFNATVGEVYSREMERINPKKKGE